jgi:hypothetical protein
VDARDEIPEADRMVAACAQRLGEAAVGLDDGPFERVGIERGAIGDLGADQPPAVEIDARPERFREVLDGPGRRFRGERGQGHARSIVRETVSRSRHLLPGRPGHCSRAG